jgi:hypothetical protein
VSFQYPAFQKNDVNGKYFFDNDDFLGKEDGLSALG